MAGRSLAERSGEWLVASGEKEKQDEDCVHPGVFVKSAQGVEKEEDELTGPAKERTEEQMSEPQC